MGDSMAAGKGLPLPQMALTAAEEQGRAVLAGGCFWCVEAVFRDLEGVQEVMPGYSGGSAATADYRTVCSGTTGHAEAVEIRYDPRRIGYGQLLQVFFAVAHDPTQHDRQGNDVGTQYRSVIFAVDAAQARVARAYIRQLNETDPFVGHPIVTEVRPLEAFYPAEAYHHHYAERNPDQPYIRCVSRPKVEKLRQDFAPLLRTDPKE